ncbi:alpha-L-fucosidase [Sphingobacterium faecale]|uniref:alpha-L-fucosidase n=1 Tax=Sphingobacterium faecale TaxID=2803775 RepID=A0ABS1R0Z9_9SPHI|nr:alpha-L-fucosidase [Sphingobacterium faecale]MBL1407722.1 alpha-L-fucosidase [Sphingobacterium faecale]
MIRSNLLKSFVLICLSIVSYLQVSAQSSSAKAQWFQEARYGMFIHWGLYSAAEGLWKGEKLRYLNNYAEWIRYRNRISKEEYGELSKRFDWNKINPEEWVILAKEAGMKYIIMTSKHHDGVAIWDTKIGDYSLPHLAGSNRDIIKELADACRKHGMKLGFYYSHWIDWEHPYAWDHNQELQGHVSDAQFNQYWQEKVIPQLTELLTDYGDIALMWFDMWIPYQKSIIKKEQLLQVVELIRRLQPHCLINSRLGLPTDEKNVDFETFGDNQFGSTYIDHPWETPATIAHSWGYNGQENEWKSTSQLFHSLISNVSLNGGLTLNIGPRADGKVPYESTQRLHEVGDWLKVYGNSVYGATGLPLRAEQHDWGYLTTRQEGSSTFVYAQVFNWPLDQTLRISGIKTAPQEVYLMRGITKRKLSFKSDGPLLHIELNGVEPDNHVSNIILKYDQSPTIDSDIVAESTFGGLALTTTNHQDKGIAYEKYDGKQPNRIKLDGTKKIRWAVYIAEPGLYNFDLSAYNPLKTDKKISITVDKKTTKGLLEPNSLMVAEPNENNYNPEFTDRRIGQISFAQKGTYTIELTNEGMDEFWFNRIWINK